MPRHLTVAGAILLALATFTSTASAFTLGVGDRADAPAATSAALGARVYRLVIDPTVPLERYDARIYAHRAAGQEPQLVIGGTGTRHHAASRGIVPAAVAAARRWPFVYSVGVVNEPDLSGMGVCEYGRLYVQAWRSLRVLGVRRIPFGEWSPSAGLAWHAALMGGHRCPHTSRSLRRIVRDVAWHGYWDALEWGRQLRALTPRHDVRLYLTEAGAVLRCPSCARVDNADAAGMRYWRRALRMVKRDRISEVVAWDLSAAPAGAWDSSLVEPSGRPRPAFQLIRQSTN